MKTVSKLIVVLFIIMLVSCQTGEENLSTEAIEQIVSEINAINKDIGDAFNAHDVKRLMAYIEQTDDLRYVEHIKITVGWNGLRQGFEKWHPENLDLSIDTRQSHVNVLNRKTAILTSTGDIYQNGNLIHVFTWTAVFYKIEDHWKIVNAHETFASEQEAKNWLGEG